MNYFTQLCNWTSAHLCLFCRAYLHYKLIRVETCSQLINAIDKFLNKYAISVSLEKPVELQYVFWLMIKSNFEQCLYYVNTCISCNGSKKKIQPFNFPRKHEKLLFLSSTCEKSGTQHSNNKSTLTFTVPCNPLPSN